MENWETEKTEVNREEQDAQWQAYEQEQSPGVEPAPRKGNGFAVTSLVLGIVGLVFICCFFGFSFLVAIVGMVFGILSLVQNRRGTGMAVAGTALNGIAFLISVLLLTVLILFNIGLNTMKTPDIDVFYDGLPIEQELPEILYEEESPSRL